MSIKRTLKRKEDDWDSQQALLIFPELWERFFKRRIEESAKNMINMLRKFNGGFITGAYPQPKDIGVTPEIYNAAYEAVLKYGMYNKKQVGKDYA